jgi:hypothetical protein
MALTRASLLSQRRRPPADISVGNKILAALLATEYQAPSPKLDHWD